MPSKSRSKTIARDPDWLGPAVAPGEILLEEFLKPLELGQVEAARQLDISLNRLNEIVLGKRGITADTALRLARMLKTSVIELHSRRVLRPRRQRVWLKVARVRLKPNTTYAM